MRALTIFRWPALLWAVLNLLLALTRCRTGFLLDFSSFYLAGKMYREGLNPYNPWDFCAYAAGQAASVDCSAVNLNPPVLLPLFAGLTHLGMWPAYIVWQMSSLGAAVLCLLVLMRQYRPREELVLLCLTNTGLYYTIGDGQLYGYLLLLATVVVLGLERGRVQPAGGWQLLAGMCLGLIVTCKPNFLLWAALLFVAGERVVGLMAFLTLCGLHLMMLLGAGRELYGEWLWALQWRLNVVTIATNASLTTLLGLRSWMINLCVLCAGLVTLLWARRERRLHLLNAVGVLLPILLAPISWVGYIIMAYPLILRERYPSRVLVVGLVLLIYPCYGLGVVETGWQRYLYPLGLLCLFLGLTVDLWRPRFLKEWRKVTSAR